MCQTLTRYIKKISKNKIVKIIKKYLDKLYNIIANDILNHDHHIEAKTYSIVYYERYDTDIRKQKLELFLNFVLRYCNPKLINYSSFNNECFKRTSNENNQYDAFFLVLFHYVYANIFYNLINYEITSAEQDAIGIIWRLYYVYHTSSKEIFEENASWYEYDNIDYSVLEQINFLKVFNLKKFIAENKELSYYFSNK